MSLAVRPFAFPDEFADVHGRPLSFADLQREVAELRREVSAAYQRGRADGAEEALSALRAERDTALLGASQALALALAGLERRFSDTERHVARLGAELALDVADQIAARALERDPCGAIEGMLVRALREVRRGEPLRLRVSVALVAPIQAMIVDFAAQRHEPLDVTVIPDGALLPGDARLEWDGGALLLDRAARQEAVASDLAAFLAA